VRIRVAGSPVLLFDFAFLRLVCPPVTQCKWQGRYHTARGRQAAQGSGGQARIPHTNKAVGTLAGDPWFPAGVPSPILDTPLLPADANKRTTRRPAAPRAPLPVPHGKSVIVSLPTTRRPPVQGQARLSPVLARPARPHVRRQPLCRLPGAPSPLVVVMKKGMWGFHGRRGCCSPALGRRRSGA
jgi:hypothetical protein